MQFTRMRLSGFKSFVEPTEFIIHPGLTGVVGPNGCGKSNLVEALRWVMGENSPKKMRGSAMDDVIFAGTTTRPARNLAEVSLHLHNDARRAPAEFNDREELEVSRRIERESGSTYKINGREVRARDVQLMFADLATGAHSTAMVSQGRIGALINAKPTERRALLEEAAGISGLHSRRHEAELRLKAAETNLERVSDVLQQLDLQLTNLKKQARQASRYRNLQGQIRQTEAMQFFLRLTAAQGGLESARALLTDSDQETVQLTEQTAAATVAETDAAEAVPAPRLAEAEAAARLHRLVVARDGLDAEEARAIERLNEIGQRINQTDADLTRERALAHDAREALGRLDKETGTIATAQAEEGTTLAAAEADVQAADKTARAKQNDLDRLLQRQATEAAERQRLSQVIAETEARVAKLTQRLTEVTAELERLTAESAGAPDPEQAGAEVERLGQAAETARSAFQDIETTMRERLAAAATEARHAVEAAEAAAREAIERAQGAARQAIDAAAQAARQAVDQAAEAARAATASAERDRQAAEQVLQSAREAFNQQDTHTNRLAAEEAGLAKLLAAKDGDLWPPVIDALTVTPGFEKALGAALGDDLQAATDTAAATHWEALAPYAQAPALPAGARPLSELVQAPPALARRLSQIGLVEDADGQRLRAELQQGQRLVSAAGALWRWDGFTVAVGAPSAAAARLEQRNRLAELRSDLDNAKLARAEAEAAFFTARAAAEAARETEKSVRAQAQESEASARRAAQAEETDVRSRAQAEERAARESAKAAESAAVASAKATEQAQRDDAQAMERAARETARRADEALAQARAFHAQITAQAAQRRERQRGLVEATEAAQIEAEDAAAKLDADRATLAAIAPAEETRAAIEALRPELDQARRSAAETLARLETLKGEQRARLSRLEAIALERRSWENRAENAERQLRELEQRRALAHQERAEQANRPAEIAAQRQALAVQIDEAEIGRREAATALADAEDKLAQAARHARESERALAAARELKARRESDALHAEETLQDLVVRLRETMEIGPEELWPLCEHDEADPLPELNAVEQRLDRLKRERENMGPVNLRADIESDEVAQQLDALTGEKNDLIGAIDRLRQAIASLNKEGRERLVEAFHKVNDHFAKLFTKVFGGGKAHLQFVESDDPLEAGLEIMASPPGKKLQVMSLLSGGEQALTALSLLFAVFLTNPAPICVLDEVDAPLDDANVERMCNLLDEMTLAGSTRFLVVTHNPITMARMNRLFGVTMAERGVSHLVSVDLAGVEELRAVG